MNRWERWGKMVVKGLAMATVIVFAGVALSVPFSWQLLLLIYICLIADSIFDKLLPTAEK